MRFRLAFCLPPAIGSLLIFACGFGGESPNDNDDGDTSYTLSFPLTEGVNWTYNCTETGPDTTYLLTKTISGSRVIPHDTTGYVVPEYPASLSWFRQLDRDSTFFLNDGDYIWMGFMDPTIASFGADPFVPIRAIPLEYTIGDTFSTLVHKAIGFLETDITFFVTATSHEDVTVPAGTFENCLRLDTELIVSFGSDTTLSTIWCANGIGLVKRDDYYESGSEHTYFEELTEYDIAP